MMEFFRGAAVTLFIVFSLWFGAIPTLWLLDKWIDYWFPT